MAISAIQDKLSSQLPSKLRYVSKLRFQETDSIQTYIGIASIEISILKYLPMHEVLLCTACLESYCLPPNSVAIHLLKFHSEILSKKQRVAIVKYSKSIILKNPEKIKIPPREQGPIPGLHIAEEFECLECRYVCRLK